MKLIAISDTHGYHRSLKIPDGYILIHAGDLTRHGSLDDVIEVNDFLGNLPHPYKIIIAGNHDLCYENHRKACEDLLTNGTTTFINASICDQLYQPVNQLMVYDFRA